MAAQYRTINRGGHSIYEEIRKAGYEPWVVCAISARSCGLIITARMDYIRFFHLRSYDRINAPQCESALELLPWGFLTEEFPDNDSDPDCANGGVFRGVVP